MPLFYYQALSADNSLINGEMEAGSQEAVITQLQGIGYFPIAVTATASHANSTRSGKDIRQAEVRLITQQLATMLNAGLTLDGTLTLLISGADSAELAAMLEKVLASVHNGLALSSALAQHSNAFDRFYLNTLKAGESAGALATVLQRLADHLTYNDTIRKNVQSALIYPAILVVVALATLLVLLVYVVPQFQVLFADMGRALPLATQVVIALAEGIKNYGWLLLIGLVVLVWFGKRMLADPKARYPWDKLVLTLPLLSTIVVRLEVARFSRTLATLLGNGVPMLSGLAIAADSLQNTVIGQAVNNAKKDVQEGQALSAALHKQAVFPALAVQLLQVGEASGELSKLLDEVADIYDKELKNAIQHFLAVLEPLLIIMMGLIIAAIIISILLAILALNDFTG